MRLGRPCARCIKRGLAATCRDGVRKVPGSGGQTTQDAARYSWGQDGQQLVRGFTLPGIAMPSSGQDLRGTAPTVISPALPTAQLGGLAYGAGRVGGAFNASSLHLPPVGLAPPSSIGALVGRPAPAGSAAAAVRRPGTDPFVWARPTGAGLHGDSNGTDGLASTPSADGGVTSPTGTKVGTPGSTPGSLAIPYGDRGGSGGAGNDRQPTSPDHLFVSDALSREFTMLNDILTAPVDGVRHSREARVKARTDGQLMPHPLLHCGMFRVRVRGCTGTATTTATS